MPKTTSPDRAARPALELQLEPHRRELIAYSYRMLGSSFEAEDAVQETFVRAWRAYDSFEGRASLRSWLYRIATNVCLDMLGSAQRRARPMDMGPSSVAPNEPGPAYPEATWIQPMPDAAVLADTADPAEAAVQRETVRLAFIAALQHLPPRQRAVLILRDVLRWRAAEVARLIGSTVASVNSALQRARATLAEIGPTAGPSRELDEQERALVARYVAAFERYDITSLTALLRDDAVMSMPPYALWLVGPAEIARWLVGPGFKCQGSRLVATAANGSPAFGQYRCADDGGYTPWALVVLETDGECVTGINSFLDTPALFPLFGLPARLEA